MTAEWHDKPHISKKDGYWYAVWPRGTPERLSKPAKEFVFKLNLEIRLKAESQ